MILAAAIAAAGTVGAAPAEEPVRGCKGKGGLFDFDVESQTYAIGDRARVRRMAQKWGGTSTGVSPDNVPSTRLASDVLVMRPTRVLTLDECRQVALAQRYDQDLRIILIEGDRRYAFAWVRPFAVNGYMYRKWDRSRRWNCSGRRYRSAPTTAHEWLDGKPVTARMRRTERIGLHPNTDPARAREAVESGKQHTTMGGSDVANVRFWNVWKELVRATAVEDYEAIHKLGIAAFEGDPRRPLAKQRELILARAHAVVSVPRPLELALLAALTEAVEQEADGKGATPQKPAIHEDGP
jgi:hypothetical protein